MQSNDIQTRRESSNKIIQHHVLGAMGVGMIPMPLVDLLALSGVQLNMLRKLCALYNVPFSKDAAKSSVAALLGGTIPIVVSGTLASLVKAIPVVGQTTATLVMPGVSGAMMYATGKVFVQHFESGGTFLTFDPDQVRDYYEQMLEEGKLVAPKLKATAEASTPEDVAASPEKKPADDISSERKKNDTAATEKDAKA